MINTDFNSLNTTVYDAKTQVSSLNNAQALQEATKEETTDSNDAAGALDMGNHYNLTKATYAAPAGYTTYATTTLKLGSTGAAVTTLQKNLTKLGYDTKGTDGIFGNDTKNAVITFQKAYGLTADGIVGTATQNAITKALDYQSKGILTVGSRGAAVTELQKNLTKLGYDTKGTDGIFGNDTKNAVIAFQRDHSLTQDGIVGSNTKNAITNALNALGQTNPPTNSTTIQRMLDNLRNDTSLGLSSEKKTAMVMAAERLLNENYEVEFVAGVLGNIQNEGTPGKFESSAYISNPSAEPAYLKYMDEHFDYRNKFSGKSIQTVGISAAMELEQQAKASGFEGKFGFGMIQWTGSRTEGVLKSYQKYCTSDKPTMDECIKAEVNFMADELNGSYHYVYNNWKNGSKTAASAGDIVCRQYEVPRDTNAQATARAQNATNIYNVMMK